MPEDEKKQEEKTLRRVEVDLGKYSPPPEPVNVSPFQSKIVQKGLTPPPPEPVTAPPFAQTKPSQPKESKETKAEG